MQIINDVGFAEKMGTGLGTGLGAGLEELANLKLKQLKERHQAKAYEQVGLPGALALLDPKIAAQYLKQQAALKQQQLGVEQYNKMQNQLNAQNQDSNVLSQLLPQQIQGQNQYQDLSPQASAVSAVQGSGLENMLGNIPGMDVLQQNAPEIQQIQQNESQQAQQDEIKKLQELQKSTPSPAQLKRMSPEEKRKVIAKYVGIVPEKYIDNALKEIDASEEQKRHEENELTKRWELVGKEREKILDDHDIAQSDLEELKRMEELDREGEGLDTPGYLEFLERSGFDIPSLKGGNTQEFVKLSANWIRNAKSYFGGKITNTELEKFLETVPSLMQSPEGRKRVIANLKKVARIKEARYDSYREILRENKNIPPRDLREQVNDRTDEKIKKITKKFKEDLGRPVRAAQNPLATIAQSVAGSGVGHLPGIATGAGLGALVGGPIGALAGGALGPKALSLITKLIS